MIKCKNPYRLTKGVQRPFFVGCGKCLYCKIQRRKSWTMRIMNECETNRGKNAFITLTYELDKRPLGNTLSKEDLQKFFKRLRKHFKDKKFKYFAVGEYGEKPPHFHPHYHAITMGLSAQELQLNDNLNKIWGKGITDIGEAEQDSIRYVAQYVDKKIGWKKEEWPEWYIEPFQLQSKGIGLEYYYQNRDKILSQEGIRFRGKINAIPRYYVKKDPDNEELKTKFREKSELALADFMLQNYPETDGRTTEEMSLLDSYDYLIDIKKKNVQMDQNLRAQAKIHKLKNKEKRL